MFIFVSFYNLVLYDVLASLIPKEPHPNKKSFKLNITIVITIAFSFFFLK